MGRAFEYRRAAKEKRWDKMSRVFPKLAKAITVAAKEGGGEPETNAKLRTAILNAKAENMPKDNIDAAIKRATNKDLAAYNEINYEAKGPHGSLLFIECATDNPTRTVANVKMYLSRNNGELVPSGSLNFMFSRKAVFEFALAAGSNLEDLELELIDSGLEEIEEVEGTVYAYADYTAFGAMNATLEKLGVQVQKANLQRIPNSPIEANDTQMVEIEKLIDKLEEDDDVQAVFTNLA